MSQGIAETQINLPTKSSGGGSTPSTWSSDCLWSCRSFWADHGGGFTTGSSWGFNVATANSICAILLSLRYPISVRQISIGMGTINGGTVSVAVYNFAGNLKLIDPGVPFNGGLAGKQTATLGTPVILQPGSYWCASSESAAAGNSAAGGATLVTSGGATGQWNNFPVVRVADATGVAGAGGSMPASLGVLNPSSRTTVPGFFMNP